MSNEDELYLLPASSEIIRSPDGVKVIPSGCVKIAGSAGTLLYNFHF